MKNCVYFFDTNSKVVYEILLDILVLRVHRGKPVVQVNKMHLTIRKVVQQKNAQKFIVSEQKVG